MSEAAYRGIVCIGDPHLCSWAPGYRKDEMRGGARQASLGAGLLARSNDFLPVLLGDLFHVPRDNANWLIIQLMQLLEPPILTIVGNHDLSEDLLCDHDSLEVLLAAGRLRRLDQRPWIGSINGVPVAIGGTDNGQKLPRQSTRSARRSTLGLLDDPSRHPLPRLRRIGPSGLH